MQFEVVAENLGFPEGPVVMPDGSIIVVEIAAGRVTRVWGEGRTEVVAVTGGGPNGAALGPDGAIYVCNSGAIDPELGCHLDEGPDAVGRIERIDPATGTVDRLYERCGDITLGAPNDLVFDGAGGVGLSGRGKTVCVADPRTPRVIGFALAGPGELAPGTGVRGAPDKVLATVP